MAEIRNYTMNFGSGRPLSVQVAVLTCRGKLACAEIHVECAGAEQCHAD